MFHRLCNPSESKSFFLFGARGTGKSTLLKSLSFLRDALWIDLLKPSEEFTYSNNPEQLIAELKLAPRSWVVIDEVQKCPKLLDVVHWLIENTTTRFALTGSSARKLRHGAANLLAGRAFIYHLFPMTITELVNKFSLAETLHWGTLPMVYGMPEDDDKKKYLQAYAYTYLKEEVWAEHLIRKLDPFRKFLEVAAQSNGKIVNYSNIQRDCGADIKTVQSYFQILEDTLLGFFLEPYHSSIRKRLKAAPKFYFFDIGVTRALARLLDVKPTPSTSYYGDVFEHFIISECHRLNEYYQKNFRFSYLQTQANVELDLIIERPGLPLAVIEIKSTSNVRPDHINGLLTIGKELKNAERFCLCQEQRAREIDGVQVFPWQQGLDVVFNHRIP